MYPMIENFVLSENERTQKFMLTGTWKKFMLIGTWKKTFVSNYINWE